MHDCSAGVYLKITTIVWSVRLSQRYCKVLQHIHLRTFGRVMGLLFANPWWWYFSTPGCAIHPKSCSTMHTLLYSSMDSLLRCLHNLEAITPGLRVASQIYFPNVPSRRLMTNSQTFLYKLPYFEVCSVKLQISIAPNAYNHTNYRELLPHWLCFQQWGVYTYLWPVVHYTQPHCPDIIAVGDLCLPNWTQCYWWHTQQEEDTGGQRAVVGHRWTESRHKPVWAGVIYIILSHVIMLTPAYNNLLSLQLYTISHRNLKDMYMYTIPIRIIIRESSTFDSLGWTEQIYVFEI